MKTGISRARLSGIERGYFLPNEAEAAQIASALNELIAAKTRIREVALEAGWPAKAALA